MEIRRGLFGPKDADIFREHRIESHEKSCHWNSRRGVKMGDHAEGVDTGIGAAGTVQGDGFVTEVRQPFLQFFLDGRFTMVLPLPAVVAAAIVGDQQPDIACIRGSTVHPSTPRFQENRS